MDCDNSCNNRTGFSGLETKRHGHSVMEFALFLPFLLFLFVGAFDWGFYAWALISTEDAARVAALYTSSSAATASDSTGACTYAVAELAFAPNVAYTGGLGISTQKPGNSDSSGSLGGGGGGSNTTTGQSSGQGGSGNIATCAGPPVTVVAISLSGPDGTAASQVSVTYQTPVLIPIPGLLTGQMNITRVVQLKVKS